tara:strand:- start:211 stop:903 length:693 start_codon:yes stop_codon:yes gene_type:complete
LLSFIFCVFLCYIFKEIALELKMILPMEKFTFDSILLLGNHANLYLAEIKTFSELPVQSLIFKKKNPFLENAPHQLLLDEVSIDYNGNYTLNELSFALSVVVNHNKKLKNTLVVGDPSELLYQAYVFAQTNQNPHFIREEAQFFSEQINDTYAFLYPVGMVAQDVRKEISQLVYVLKKFNKSTFLIRAHKSDVIAILQKMLNQLGVMNEFSKFSVKGVEQLISRQEHFST